MSGSAPASAADAASAAGAAVAAAAASLPGASGSGGGSFLNRVTETLRSYLTYLLELYQSGWRFRWLMHALVGLGVLFLAARAMHRRYIAKYKADLRATEAQPEYGGAHMDEHCRARGEQHDIDRASR